MPRHYSQTFGVVGAILEKDGKIALVKESGTKKHPDNGKWNHPAGWLDVGEDPIVGAKREAEEETGYKFTPTSLLGIYSLVRNDVEKDCGGTPHPIKMIFVGEIDTNNQSPLSEDVSEVRWFTPQEIYDMDQSTLRDADIKTMVKNYFEGKKYPLEVLSHYVQE